MSFPDLEITSLQVKKINPNLIDLVEETKMQ